MTTLDNIDVPEAVLQAAYDAWVQDNGTVRESLSAAIRAALQAWMGSGRASLVGRGLYGVKTTALILRLDAITKEPEHE